MTNINMIDNSEAALSRREIFKKVGMGAAAVTLAGMGLSATASTAQAQATLNTWLNYSLRIASLANAFYGAATTAVTGITNFDAAVPDTSVIATVKAHKVAHAAAIAAISGSGTATPTAGSYDFTAGGVWPLNTATTGANRANFYVAATLIEDMGVRIHKAALREMYGHASLETNFRIHSVWGMDAGIIRRMASGSATAGQAWVSSTGPGGTPATNTVGYLQNLVYGGPTTNASTVGVVTNEDNQYQLSNAIASSAQWFDEPAQLAPVAASGSGSTAVSAQLTGATAFLQAFNAL